MTTLTAARLNVATYHTVLASPVGELTLTSNGEALTGLHFEGHRSALDARDSTRRDEGPFAETRRQLEAYFDSDLTEFTIPLSLNGTAFQRRVWEELSRIPFGVTISYRELARRVGNPAASRAVGTANGRNPVAIIVPCHRVIAADGTLGGYGGGLDRKTWLLDIERVAPRRSLPQ